MFINGHLHNKNLHLTVLRVRSQFVRDEQCHCHLHTKRLPDGEE